MIIIPIKLLFHWEYTQHFQTNPFNLKRAVIGPTCAKVGQPVLGILLAEDLIFLSKTIKVNGSLQWGAPESPKTTTLW